MSAPMKIIRQTMSEMVQAGYKCSVCNVETIVFAKIGDAPIAPVACLNCGVVDPVLVWGPHIERTTTAIESI